MRTAPADREPRRSNGALQAGRGQGGWKPCERNVRVGNHLYRDALYRWWQVGMVCTHCGRRKRTRKTL